MRLSCPIHPLPSSDYAKLTGDADQQTVGDLVGDSWFEEHKLNFKMQH